MKKQIPIMILGLMLMVTFVSAMTYGSVEQDIEFKSEDTSSPSSGGSSSGSSGGSVSGWSAQCGYNKECLYGSSNDTVVEPIVETIEEPIEPTTTEPTVQEEGTSMLKKVVMGFIVFLSLVVLGIILWLIFKPKEEIDNQELQGGKDGIRKEE